MPDQKDTIASFRWKNLPAMCKVIIQKNLVFGPIVQISQS